MAVQRQMDAVDAILQQWHRERPDLDVSPMGVIGRLGRCAALLRRELDKLFSSFGLTAWEFDVLATLRRSGEPYRLAPTTLFSTLMVTSGTMTRQLQQLEAAGWVSRIANPSDARSMLVQLTPAGLELIDRAVTAHVANEARLLAPIASTELAQLEARLSQLLTVLEPAGE
ncbi:MarR family transcriptional regulator [Pseudomonas sp. SG20056]|uniref:MarR family winged helix-turn-helix transcriptional regulator n=1 Tax=Pseudomonas sp. SG20056 TaxID=3074146 RepID=UPI00287F4D1D|nr:MarR family transcriptional regulator [Pseudomonas sp. SG20056]WNF47780.1 MarR family transcriptional regulator [Pseudomonas sp. SG20056]